MNTGIEQVATMQLGGEPYIQDLPQADGGSIRIDCNESLNKLAHSTGYAASLPEKVDAARRDMAPLFEQQGFYTIDDALKHGKDLTFEESFSLTSFVCSALNRPLARIIKGDIKGLPGTNDVSEFDLTHMLQATALLEGMSVKEAYRGLTSSEIAGLVAGTIHLDTVVRTETKVPILSFGGMGGDKGYDIKNGEASKLFSLSTLGSLVLSAVGPVHKHHSYPNTSKLAGQTAIEKVGARSDFHSPEAYDLTLKESGLFMSSCHNTRTIHTLSHILKGETINHIIGPLAFTVSAESPVQAFIGVNEKVHPDTILDALTILSEKGYQQYGNSAVYCGTNLKKIDPKMLKDTTYYANPKLKERVRIDEIAPFPYASLVGFAVDGKPKGTYALYQEDFYDPRDLKKMSLKKLLIPNNAEEILRNNRAALSGEDEAKSMYLAMTAGLGIFTTKYLTEPDALDVDSRRVNQSYLRAATKEALEVIQSGLALDKLQDYVAATKLYAGDKGAEWINGLR